MESIVERLERWAAVQPDRVVYAFIGMDGRETDALTYRELARSTRALAAHLAREVGLRRGERALLAYAPGLAFIEAFLACARLGAIPVPVPPAERAALRRHGLVAESCGARVVLSERALCASASGPLAWHPTDLRGELADGDRADDPGDVLFLQYTSGSTGEPRGVVVSHRNVLANCEGTLTDVPAGVSWLPHFHDMGLIGYLLFPLLAGGSSHCLSPLAFLKRPALWLRAIAHCGATQTSSPSFGFEYCLRPGKLRPGELDGVDLRSLRVLMNAAEPVCPDTYERFVERLLPFGLDPRAATAAYGLAENTLAVTHGGRGAVDVSPRLLARSVVRPVPGGAARVRVASCGRPSSGVTVRIVDPDSALRMPDGAVGEIWVSGPSVCGGYWNRPEETARAFRNRLAGEPGLFLRTGDLGFLRSGELFVCGRTKDLIIVRGANHYPRDIEAAALAASERIRPNGVAAFTGGPGESLVVVAEVAEASRPPELAAIAHAVRAQCAVEPDAVALVPTRSLVRTTSGKLARAATRERWLAGELELLSVRRAAVERECETTVRERFDWLWAQASEGVALGALGLDSLALAELGAALEEFLDEHGASELAPELDGALLQELDCAELRVLLESLEAGGAGAIDAARSRLHALRGARALETAARMRADAQVAPGARIRAAAALEPPRSVLLTGATGFFGPFLLERLLRDTACTFHALVRARDPADGLRRVRESLARAGLLEPRLEDALAKRVHVHCGDLAKPRLGCSRGEWELLARETHAVVHNGALVNYVRDYRALRAANVAGTRALLDLACAGPPKAFHLISTTFVFGWTAAELLFESDANDAMRELDFGYAQTKWVAEQLVRAAGRAGLPVQIYRPALVTVSTAGRGDAGDVLVRALAFMINHGIGVDSANQLSVLPADVVAANVVALFREFAPPGRTFHVVTDACWRIGDLTRSISRQFGYPIAHYEIPRFVAELNLRCRPHEPVYPLLDFFNRSAERLAAMQRKRYDSRAYRAARDRAPSSRRDPSLDEIAAQLVAFLVREGMIPPPRAHG